MICQIAVVNKSALITADEVAAAVAAVQRQISEHFAPAWGVDARLGVVAASAPPAANVWTMTLVDHAEVKDALGFHDDDGGLPTGTVDVARAIEDHVPWSAVLSHEVLELLADPDATQTRAVDPDGLERWALEVCDPVEGSGGGLYRIDGIEVENFVLPNYWTPGSPGTWDYLGALKAPLTLSSNGYAQVLSAAGWKQRNADGVRRSKLVPAPASRRARRIARHNAQTRIR